MNVKGKHQIDRYRESAHLNTLRKDVKGKKCLADPFVQKYRAKLKSNQPERFFSISQLNIN